MIIRPTQVTTNEVRISYEHLLKPYAQQPGAEEKFSATLLIPKSDVQTKNAIDQAIKSAIDEGASGKWGGVRPAQPATPIYDGDGVRPSGELFGEECKGHWVMTASSRQRQDVVDTNLQPIIDATQVYSGMYARVVINFFAYNANGKKGIGCGLGPVQKLRDGDPLGGRVTAEVAFGAMPTTQPQYAPPTQQYAQTTPAVNPVTGLPY